MGGPGGRPSNMKTENQSKKLIGGMAQFLAAFGFYLTSGVQSKEPLFSRGTGAVNR